MNATRFGKQLLFAALLLMASFSALTMSGIVLISTAWLGVHFATVLYLSIFGAGTAILLIGSLNVFFRKKMLYLISGISASLLTLLSLFLLIMARFFKDQNFHITIFDIDRTVSFWYVFPVVLCTPVVVFCFEEARSSSRH